MSIGFSTSPGLKTIGRIKTQNELAMENESTRHKDQISQLKVSAQDEARRQGEIIQAHLTTINQLQQQLESTKSRIENIAEENEAMKYKQRELVDCLKNEKEQLEFSIQSLRSQIEESNVLIEKVGFSRSMNYMMVRIFTISQVSVSEQPQKDKSIEAAAITISNMKGSIVRLTSALAEKENSFKNEVKSTVARLQSQWGQQKEEEDNRRNMEHETAIEETRREYDSRINALRLVTSIEFDICSKVISKNTYRQMLVDGQKE